MNDTMNRYLSILCYPFASMDFFLQDYFEEMIRAEGDAERKYLEEKLKQDLIKSIQRISYVYSYDEIYMYLEKFYLYPFRTNRYSQAYRLYGNCFHSMMRSMISQRDGKIVFKYWESKRDKEFLGGFGDVNKIFLFHSMNMHIPLDFMIMLYMVQNPENDIWCLNHYYGQIEAADQQLAAVLKAGVAENHLHKGVSVSFLEIWEALMMPMSSIGVKGLEGLELKLSDGNVSEGEGLFFLLAAALVRVFIALQLKRYDWDRMCFREESIIEISTNVPEGDLEAVIRNFERGKNLKELYRSRWGAAEEQRAKHEVLAFYQKQWDILLSQLPKQPEGRTLMQEIFQVPSQVHTSDEHIFLFYGMKFLKEQQEKEQTGERQQRLIRYLLQYLRIKHYVFGCTVQKKTVRGLDYFQKEFYQKDSKMNRFYGSMAGGAGNGNSLTAYWELAMRKQFQNRDLKKIEFRASIDKTDGQFRKSVRAFLEAYRNVLREDYCRKREDGSYEVIRPCPRVGLIYHLIKRKDEQIPEKCFLDGQEQKEKLQFGLLEETYAQEIMRMRKLRDEIKGLDRYIVGLDAASLENATPTWVFTGAYESARDSSLERIGYDGSQRQSLRFTFHAGEDFRHILSGLRRMDEAVTFLKFHAGDRIGHGTALGISPEKWGRYSPFVVMPRMEALENYIWAYYVLSQDLIHVPSTLLAYMERRIQELAQSIYGNSQSIPLQVLAEGYLNMFHRPVSLQSAPCRSAAKSGFCEAVRAGTCGEIIWNSDKLVFARHCRKFLLKMEEPIDYEVTQQDLQITKALQKALRQKLSRKGIVVEINPSSNLAIGEVDKITENQIYQLNVPDGEENVMVCINSDDPTVFHTNVSNEMAYIYYGMLYRAISREKALEWIDRVRECGLCSSFIQAEDTDQQALEMLEKIIESL